MFRSKNNYLFPSILEKLQPYGLTEQLLQENDWLVDKYFYDMSENYKTAFITLTTNRKLIPASALAILKNASSDYIRGLALGLSDEQINKLNKHQLNALFYYGKRELTFELVAQYPLDWEQVESLGAFIRADIPPKFALLLAKQYKPKESGMFAHALSMGVITITEELKSPIENILAKLRNKIDAVKDMDICQFHTFNDYKDKGVTLEQLRQLGQPKTMDHYSALNKLITSHHYTIDSALQYIGTIDKYQADGIAKGLMPEDAPGLHQMAIYALSDLKNLGFRRHHFLNSHSWLEEHEDISVLSILANPNFHPMPIEDAISFLKEMNTWQKKALVDLFFFGLEPQHVRPIGKWFNYDDYKLLYFFIRDRKKKPETAILNVEAIHMGLIKRKDRPDTTRGGLFENWEDPDKRRLLDYYPNFLTYYQVKAVLKLYRYGLRGEHIQHCDWFDSEEHIHLLEATFKERNLPPQDAVPRSRHPQLTDLQFSLLNGFMELIAPPTALQTSLISGFVEFSSNKSIMFQSRATNPKIAPPTELQASLLKGFVK